MRDGRSLPRPRLQAQVKPELHLGQGHLFCLVLILASAGFVANLAGLALKENQLYYPLASVNPTVGARGVRKL